MNNALKITIGLFAIIIIGAIVLSFGGKKSTNWRETYHYMHKSPFGTYILYEELETLFPDQKVNTLSKNAFDYFDDAYNYVNNDYNLNGNYIFINRNMTTIDDETSEEILNFVSHGNSAFIASNHFQYFLKDSLGFETNYSSDFFTPNEIHDLDAKFSFANDQFKNKEYNYSRNIKASYFEIVDSSKVEILGWQKINDTLRPNFIKANYINGEVYLHSQPIIFTNYHLLNGNQQYVANALSYLNDSPIHWDPHYSYRKGSGNSKSSLSYFLSHKALKWAFWLTLLSIALFVFFNAKRRQRIIPIIKPLQNTTLDFTKTIGNLYFQQNNHKDIIHRKIIFFLEKIRNDYFVDTQNLNQEFIEKLSNKSGKSEGEIKLLVNTILRLNNNHLSTEDDLLRLNELIEKFFEKESK